MSTITVTPSGQACGATVTGVDLSQPLDDVTRNAIRAAWLEHLVLAFPDQQIDDPALERLTGEFGKIGEDPFFESIDASTPVVALTRRADEQAPVFAEAWHADWSFLPEPPIGTCLYSLTIPPVGGDTTFANQRKALAEMPADLRAKIEGRMGVHSAELPYAPDGTYGEKDEESDRSMKIVTSEAARERCLHPLIRRHEETGEESLYSCFGYIIGIEGMDDAAARDLLLELYQWQTRPEFLYTHRWAPNMFVIWDNRCVLHRANGGYDGFERELHRTTVAADRARFLAAAS